MTAHFTPGPWIIVDTDFGPCDDSDPETTTYLPIGINDANGESVLRMTDVWGLFFGADQPDGAIAWANAHLIAAAPDLYAACLRIIDMEGEGTIYEPGSPFSDVVEAVRKAQEGMK